MTRNSIFLFPAIALLSACATPEEATISRADVRAFAADDTRADALDFTPTANIPTGTATYNGHIRSDAIINSEDDYIVAGDLELNVDIADTATRSSNITGAITNVNVLDNNNDGFDDQRLRGELTLSGDASEGNIDAKAIGVLSGVFEDTIGDPSATWELDLNGRFRDDFENADVVSGRVSGGTQDEFSDDYDVTLIGTGRFYGERDD